MVNNFEDITLQTNPDPRCPCVLVLDASDSMVEKFPGEDRSPMEALNGGLDTLIAALNKDPLARRRAEISAVTFGTEVSEPTPFATVDNLVLPTLTASGITSMGAAVNKALDAIEARKREYKANAISYYRPICLLITDGLPTDDIKEACSRVRDLETKKGVAFFAVGVEGADMDVLSKFSERGALPLRDIAFDELFTWLSASMSAVSASNPGEKVQLPNPSGWMEI